MLAFVVVAVGHLIVYIELTYCTECIHLSVHLTDQT
jgi:hypothetical protein